jgi:hypothetical protein
MEQIADQHGFEDVELPSVVSKDGWLGTNLECTAGAGDGDGSVVSHDLSADHSHGLTLCGIHLPWHNTRTNHQPTLPNVLPRFIFGDTDFAETAAGTRSEIADIIGNLHETACEGVELTRGLDDGIVSGQCFEFVWRGFEFLAGDFGDFLGDFDVESDSRVDALSSSATL